MRTNRLENNRNSKLFLMMQELRFQQRTALTFLEQEIYSATMYSTAMDIAVGQFHSFTDTSMIVTVQRIIRQVQLVDVQVQCRY